MQCESLLVGGWTYPSEKYSSNWKSSPSRCENKKYLKPPPSFGWELLKTYPSEILQVCIPLSVHWKWIYPENARAPLEMKYMVYEDYICIHWALPKRCNSGLWKFLIIGFPSLKDEWIFSPLLQGLGNPAPICSYLPSKWQGSFFKTNLNIWNPSLPPPKKKTKETTCHLQKMDHFKMEIGASFRHPGPIMGNSGFLLLSMPQAQVSKFSKDHLLEYSCNAGSIKCNLSWKGENQEVWLEMQLQ